VSEHAFRDGAAEISTRYLTVDELIYINEQIPTISAIHKILKGKQRVRDLTLLEAAAGRPTLSAFGQDAYPTLPDKAAALLHSIARNHPFIDGNKRTATVAAVFMLAVNGRLVAWTTEDALAQILAVAEGRLAPSEFARWIPYVPAEPSPVPDAGQDAACIARILQEQARLLAELAAR
jgi:death-on-curing protein